MSRWRVSVHLLGFEIFNLDYTNPPIIHNTPQSNFSFGGLGTYVLIIEEWLQHISVVYRCAYGVMSSNKWEKWVVRPNGIFLSVISWVVVLTSGIGIPNMDFKPQWNYSRLCIWSKVLDEMFHIFPNLENVFVVGLRFNFQRGENERAITSENCTLNMYGHPFSERKISNTLHFELEKCSSRCSSPSHRTGKCGLRCSSPSHRTGNNEVYGAAHLEV